MAPWQMESLSRKKNGSSGASEMGLLAAQLAGCDLPVFRSGALALINGSFFLFLKSRETVIIIIQDKFSCFVIKGA